MKKLQLAYCKIPNMGDLLNELLMERVFVQPYVNSKHVSLYEATGIGSFLDSLFIDKNIDYHSLSIKQKASVFIRNHSFTQCNTWGTGFISDLSDKKAGLCRNNVNFMAVRGILTQKCIEKILNATIDPVLGDAGILAPMLFENQITKSNLIGIIPHFKEQDAPQVHRIKKEYPDAIVINLRKEPLDVIQEIAQCEHIISSSLHGLIIADSFRIPNIRVFFTDAPMGDGFKFDDYYSAYGLNNPPNILSDQNIPTINNIVDQYKITNDMVDKMQHDMFDCMNKYLKAR